MRKFSVDVPHALPSDEVRARLEKAKAKLESDYGATCSWPSDSVMEVARKGLDARVAIEPDKLRVDVELGFLLAPMAGAVREGITKKLSSLLA